MTTVKYHESNQEIEPKITNFELKFTGSVETIAVFEFDIGSYAGEA